MLRRALVVSNSFPAVSETFVFDQVRGLVRSGWEVHVATPSFNRLLLSNPSAHGFCVHELAPAAGLRSVGRLFRLVAASAQLGTTLLSSGQMRAAVLYARSLRAVVRQTVPHLIHAHFGNNGLLAALAAPNVPLTVDFHGRDVTVVPTREGWGPYRRHLSHAQGIVHSTFVQELVTRNTAMPVHLVPLGFDPDVFHPNHAKAAWHTPRRLIGVGRVAYEKGFHVLLGALAMLRRRFPDTPYRLTIVGNGPDVDWLRGRARLLQIDQDVTWTGALNHLQVAQQMRDHDLLVTPSLATPDGSTEAFCRVAVEGLATGLPVLASRVGGLPQTLDCEELIVPPGNADALSAAIHAVFEKRPPDAWRALALRLAERYLQSNVDQRYDAILRARIGS